MNQNIDKEIEIAEAEERRASALVERLQKLREYGGADRIIHISEVISEKGREVGMKVVGAKSRIGGLDKIIDEFREGQLVVVSAPTGQGKTTFCKTLTGKFHSQGLASVWFSYEMPPQELIESFPGTPFFYLPKELIGSTMAWLDERVAEAVAKHNIKVVFIDHLHFLVDMRKLAIVKNQSILIGVLLREIKMIALKYGVIVFLVAHIRKIDTETEMPSIDDLRDSSFVAQEADIVLLLWRQQFPRSRDEIKNKVPPEWKNETTLSVVKNRRKGKLGFVTLVYNTAENEFRELAFRDDESGDEPF